MSGRDDSKFRISKEDERLWQEFSASVKSKKIEPKAEVAPPPEDKPKPKSKAKMKAKVPARKPRVQPLPPIRIGEIGGVDQATHRRLKRGNIAVESRLDLHAMTKSQAQKEVFRWIPTARRQGKRCLLLVTGKGTGVLQASVPVFLNHLDIRPHVLACVEASPKDGGSGAFYIYLKRAS